MLLIGRYDETYCDNRGSYRRHSRKITPQLIAIVRAFIEDKQNINHKDIQEYLLKLTPPINISLSSLRVLSKKYLGARYRKIEKVSKMKNNECTILYRKEVAKQIITYIAQDWIV